MNGQTARLEIARSIIEKYGIEQIIETGTFRGQQPNGFRNLEFLFSAPKSRRGSPHSRSVVWHTSTTFRLSAATPLQH